MTPIGCFEVEELTPGRWKVRNKLTSHEHVTYGTIAELRPLLEKQTKAWEAKYAPKKGANGAAWRNTMLKTPPRV